MARGVFFEMASIVARLAKNGLLKSPPNFVVSNTMYETIMGSEAYGVSSNNSDMDVYGFCIPDKHYLFPHLAGEIVGFGRQLKRFDQFQQHHIEYRNKEYDINIYSIAKYFQLCMECNPNMLESLFTPFTAVLSMTPVGEMVRENRHLFLHKGAWHKYKGYSYSQIHAIKTKKPEGKRKELVEKYGYDVKYAYHAVRLINYIEQILTEHDLDLQRNREQLKAIRRGEWSKEQVFEYFETKERELETLYTTSTLPYKPNEAAIKELLLNCLEHHYGKLDFVPRNNSVDVLIGELQTVLDKYRS